MFSVATIITDSNTALTVTALQEYWFKRYRYPTTIFFKQGKVQTSKLETRINSMAPLEQRVTCRTWNNVLNTEMEQQWRQNKQELSEENFVNTLNFLHELQELETRNQENSPIGNFNKITEINPDISDDSDTEYELENDFRPLCNLDNEQLAHPIRRKKVRLCRHKLQGRTGCRSRGGWLSPRQQEPDWFSDPEAEQTPEVELLSKEDDPEWAQLRELEEFLKL